MHSISICEYRQEFEGKIIALWNECLSKDQLTMDIFRDQIVFDDNFKKELSLCAFADDRLIGFIFGTKRVIPYLERGLEREKAWINAISVDPEYREKGIGTRLLDELERRLKQDGTERIILGGYSPNYFYPGVDTQNYGNAIGFFEKRGYSITGYAVSMRKHLYDFQMPERTVALKEKLEEQGYQFIPFEYKYSLKLIDFLKDEFGGGWKRNALMAIRSKEAHETVILAVNHNDDVVGFCMRKMDGFANRFGPFGVKSELRSLGLGGVLFDLMQEDMKKRRLFDLYFLWTHGPGQRFYEKHGVGVYREFKLMNKGVCE